MRRFSFRWMMTLLVCLTLAAALGQPGDARAENLETPVFTVANEYDVDIATAVKVGQDYWAEVYSGFFNSTVYLKIGDPQGLYASWSVEPNGKEVKPGVFQFFGGHAAWKTIDGNPSYVVTAYNAAGEPAAVYNLYVSYHPAPEAGGTEPEPQPEPELIVTPVSVVHQTESGVELKRAQEEITAGSARTFYAESFPNYVVAEGTPAEMTVSVDATGVPSVNPVVFRYREIPAAATVTVTYTTESGDLLLQRNVEIPSGSSQTIQAESLQDWALAEGQGAAVTVAVDAAGNPSQGTVNFVMRAMPHSAVIPIQDVDEGGELLGSRTLEVSSGASGVALAQSYHGYMLAEGQPTEVTVSVDAGGNANPASVRFVYRRLPESGSVTVQDVAEDGTPLDARTVTIPSNTAQNVTPQQFEGYVLADGQPASVEVIVDAYGNANPASVRFVYRALPRSANVPILDMAENGTQLGARMVEISSGTSQTVQAVSFEGYTLAEGQPASVTVTVDSLGIPTPDSVTFLYHQLPATGAVTVIYRTEEGLELQRETVELASGSDSTIHVKALPGYQLVGGQPEVKVTVGVDGTPSAQEVVFILRKVPDSAAVTVRSVDGEGKELAVRQENVPTGLNKTIFAESIQGYALAENQPSEITVLVDATGVATPAEVVFVYTKLPQSADITVRYILTDDNSTLRTEVKTIAGNTSEKIAAQAPEGYLLMEGQPQEVTVSVDMDGKPSQAEVVFYVTLPPPVDGTVTVRYLSVGGRDLVEPFQVTVPGNATTVIEPEESRLPMGFDVESAPAQSVTATRAGVVTPASVSFTFKRLISAEETPIPAGETIDRWALTTGKGLNVRKEPRQRATQVAQIARTGSYVWATRETVNDAGEKWTQVLYNGKTGYILSNFLDVLSQAESDDYQETLPSPVPTSAQTNPPQTATPAPVTPAPATQAPTDAPATPTRAPVATATNLPETPQPTAVPAQYGGYALTRRLTTLRYETQGTSGTIHVIPQDTLVYVSGQTYDSAGVAWSSVRELNGSIGYVRDTDLVHISDDEATYYLEAYERASRTATPSPRPTQEPTQWSGYAYTIGDNVMFRSAANDHSVILSVLRQDTPVYVSGQSYPGDGWAWHSVLYNGSWGFIRSDMLRMMSAREQSEYLQGLTTASATPTPLPQTQINVTAAPSTMSSYGYIYSSNNGVVNVRRTPSTGADVVMRLRSYALALVLGTQRISDTTWYYIDYNGTRGYIHGNYFKQMTIAEMETFLQSDNYLKGLQSNSTNAKASVTPAAIVSVEQQNAEIWSDPNSAGNVAYATWAPIRTTEPLPVATPTPTFDPYTATATATTEPTATVSFAPLTTPVEEETPVPIGTREPDASPEHGSPIGWILLVLVLILGAGGGYAYYLNQKNKRTAAQRAAQRRAQAERGSAPQARTSVSGTAQRPGAQPQGQTPRPVSRTETPYEPKFTAGQVTPPQQRSAAQSEQLRQAFPTSAGVRRDDSAYKPAQPRTDASAPVRQTQRPAQSQQTRPFQPIQTAAPDTTAQPVTEPTAPQARPSWEVPQPAIQQAAEAGREASNTASDVTASAEQRLRDQAASIVAEALNSVTQSHPVIHEETPASQPATAADSAEQPAGEETPRRRSRRAGRFTDPEADTTDQT